jgi:hypothetical protein
MDTGHRSGNNKYVPYCKTTVKIIWMTLLIYNASQDPTTIDITASKDLREVK